MPNVKQLLPTILAFWLALAFIFLFGQHHPQFAVHGRYVLFFGQVFFDAIALFALIKVMRLQDSQHKFVAGCGMLAVLCLLISDFFYHTIVSLHWFDIQGSELYSMPLTGFFVFLILAFLRANSIYKDADSGSHVFGFIVLLAAAMAVIVTFFPKPDMVLSFGNISDVVASAQMILEVLAIVAALIVMGKVNKTSFNYFCVGVFMIFFANFLFNWQGIVMAANVKGLLELLWLFGSILIATGAKLKLEELSN